MTIDAMGTQPGIAQAIRDRGANYILSLKDNQPTLAASVSDFFEAFQGAPGKTPHTFDEVVEKDHGRLDVRQPDFASRSTTVPTAPYALLRPIRRLPYMFNRCRPLPGRAASVIRALTGLLRA